jgi:hypothetical protein
VHPVEQFAQLFAASRNVPVVQFFAVKQLCVEEDQTAGGTQFEVHPKEEGLKPSTHELQLIESVHERQLLVQDWHVKVDWLK